MKKIGLILLGFVFLHSARAQQVSNAVGDQGTLQKQPVADVLILKETEHNFGQIPQGKPVFYFFDIRNNGDVPLKLDNVQASCGCTTPEWSKDPVAAGTWDKIKVGFNAASEGHFEKFITITYNGNQTKQIKISGDVWKAPSGSAPVNASVQFLKQQIQ